MKQNTNSSKMKRNHKFIIRMLTFFSIGILAIIVMSSAAYAVTVSQGYKSESDIPIGTIVSLSGRGDDEVEKATIDNQSQLVGVATGAENSVIDVQPKGTKVRVASSGNAKMFVTTLGGEITEGDKLVLSPIAGIATRSVSGTQGRVVAVARESVGDENSSFSSVEVQATNGEKEWIKIGLIKVDLTIESDRQATATVEADNNVLTQVASQVAGKSVSTTRIVTAGVVFASSIAVAGVILQGSVRGTFVSLGRNPLSKSSLIPALARVSALAIFILSAGSSVAYFILSA